LTAVIAGLPDFSWYNIPNRVKCTKTGENTPSGYYLNVPNGRNIEPKEYKMCQRLQLQDPPKFTQNGIFGLKIKPSGNPASMTPHLNGGKRSL
jgi:hypothetical protein